jgi:single-strand DNA-binding protein
MANRVFIMGRLGGDPTLRYLANGTALSEFSVATNEFYKGQKKTTWHNLAAWGKLGEICNKYLKKGQQAYFEGKITYGEWEKDGVKHHRTQIIVDKMEFVGDRQDSTGPADSEDFSF